MHVHFLGAPAVIGLCTAAVAGLPLSLSPHASLEVLSPPTLRRLLRRAAFTAVCWRGAERYLSQLGSHVHYVPHGTEVSQGRARRSTGATLHLVAIARLVPKKGITVLLEAVERIHQERSDWRLTIVGDGPLRRALEAQAGSGCTANRIRFQGAITHDEVRQVLDSADVLIVPSVPVSGQTEGIPNVILEAFASGVPVVASDVGGVSEVVRHAKTGILVRPGDPAALGAALMRICRDEEPLQEYTEAAAVLVAKSYSRKQSLQVLAGLHRSVATENT